MKHLCKKIIIMIFLLITLSCGTVYAKGAKAEIWSYDLGERIEHRSISVGNEMAGFGIMITPSDLKVEKVSWTVGNKNIAEIKENGNDVSVCGLGEGTTKLNLEVQTKTEGTLEHSSIISVYTPIEDIEAYISQTTTFYRGADENAWIRSENVLPNQKITIVGSCGNYYYVKLPEDYKFDDNRSSRYTYTLKANVYIPVTKVELSEKSITLEKNKVKKVNVDIKPDIATEANINFESLNKDIVTIDGNGNIKAVKEGYTKILARSNQENVTDECGVSVYESIDMVEAEINESCNLYGGADNNEKIRSYNVNKGQKLTIIGSCDKFYYVKLPENYEFNDNGKDRMAYVAKNKLYIPVKRVVITEKKNNLKIGEKIQLYAQVYPNIATNKKIKWRVNSLAYANIDKNGILTTIKKGEVYVRAESEENKEIKDRYKIIITKDISPYILQKPIIELSRTDLAINTIRIHKCKGANEYYLYVQKKKDNGKKYWKKIYEYYGSNFETKEIRIVNSEMGKNYKYRLEVRNVNYVKKDKKEYSVIKTEYSDILSVVMGKPKVRVNKNNEICWLKMSHWNYKKGGYEIYRKNGSTYKKIKTINDYNTNKYYDEKAKKNIKYSYKIRAFYYMGKNKKFSPYSSDITIKK